LPASRISAISRADFSSGGRLVLGLSIAEFGLRNAEFKQELGSESEQLPAFNSAFRILHSAL
jgi:hypothetical protein